MRMFLIPLALAALMPACGDETHAGTGGTGGSGEPSCFEHPTTHVEIINACTTSQGIEKNPVLPLLRSDGSLPPLP